MDLAPERKENESVPVSIGKGRTGATKEATQRQVATGTGSGVFFDFGGERFAAVLGISAEIEKDSRPPHVPRVTLLRCWRAAA
jgi:hypothetical protein